MPDITKLQTPNAQARNESLRREILAAWDNEKTPTAANIVEGGDPDSIEILEHFKGKHLNDLPFGNNYFLTLSPFSYMTSDGIRYYIAGYMLNTLSVASKASENPWAGMDLPIIALLSVLTNESRNLIKRLTVAQRRCILGFLEYVRDHADFFFWEDKIHDLNLAMRNYESMG